MADGGKDAQREEALDANDESNNSLKKQEEAKQQDEVKLQMQII